jgi:hypothetical protein
VSGVETGEEWIVRSGRPRRSHGTGGVLSEERATAVANTAGQVARHFGCPQDLEWAVDRTGKMHILQARPMTALPDPVTWEPPGKGAWLGNFRMGEWLPEPVTPLFMDWVIPRIDAAYNHAVYRSAGMTVANGTRGGQRLVLRLPTHAEGAPAPPLRWTAALLAVLLQLGGASYVRPARRRQDSPAGARRRMANPMPARIPDSGEGRASQLRHGHAP